jgi:uncharacterized membrane protein YfcA
MSISHLVIYGIVGFVMSIVSGIAGAGAGFILTPLNIFLGLSPAQAIATGKFNGLSVAVGSLSGMHDASEKGAKGYVSKWRIMGVMLLALGIGLIAPHIITSLDQKLYRVLLGFILLLMIPIVILKKVGVKTSHPRLWQKYAGGALLAVALLLQGAFSGGLGSLVNIVLMGMLGMSATEANITKRWSQMILNITIVLGMLGTGLIIWQVAAVGAAATLSGSYIGGRMAIRSGDVFIMRVLIFLMLISGLFLIFGA